MLIIKNVLIAGFFTSLAYLFRLQDRIAIYLYSFKYGAYASFYVTANIKTIVIDDLTIKRDYKVRFFVPQEKIYVEGKFIGLDDEGISYWKCDDDEGMMYDINAMKREHITHIEKC